jgi:tetratricopeptide (TPR) repeat protein
MKYLLLLAALATGALAQDYNGIVDAIEKKKYDQAEAAAAAAAAGGKDLVAQYYLGHVYYLQALELMAYQPEKAKTLLEKSKTLHEEATNRKSKEPLNYVGLAYYHLAKQNIPEAMSQLLTVKSMEPNDLIALTEAAKANISLYSLPFVDSKQKTIASTNASYFVSRAEAKAPDNVEVLMASGFVYYTQGVWALSKAKYTKALAQDPANVEARFRLAKSHFEEKEYTEAEQQYKKVLELDSEYALAYRELAEFYYLWGRATTKQSVREEKFITARGYAEEFRKRVSDDLNAQVRYAEILYFTASYASAETLFRELLQKPELKESIGLKRYLAYTEIETGKCAAGKQTLESLLAGQEEAARAAIDYKYLAQAEYCLGNMEAAKTNIQKAIAQNNRFAGFFKELYDVQWEAKNYEAAYTLMQLHLSITSKPDVQDLFYAAWLANRLKDDEKCVTYADQALATYGDKVPDLYLYKARAHARMTEKAAAAKPEGVSGATTDSKSLNREMAAEYAKFLQLVQPLEQDKKEKYTKDIAESYWALAFYYYDEKNEEKNPGRAYAYTLKYLETQDKRYQEPAGQLKAYFEGQKTKPEELK